MSGIRLARKARPPEAATLARMPFLRPLVSASVLLLSLGATTAACSSPRPATEMVITVDADAEVRDASRLLVVRIFGRAPGEAFTEEPNGYAPFAVEADGNGWPRVVVVYPTNRDARRQYRVTATAYSDAAGATEVATVRLISGYVEGTSLRFRLYLQGSCIGVPCSEDSTCVDGGCVPATVDPMTLVDGGVGMDASVPLDAPGVTCSPADCDDGVACTRDVCGADGECDHEPDHERCDDVVGCTDDVCVAGVGCSHVPDATFCADTNPCSIDECDAGAGGTGCRHTNAMDNSGCDDGTFCNGEDVCIDGTCSGHTLDRCGALTCDEVDDQCDGCSGSAPCPGEDIGAYSSCSPTAATCGSSRARARTTYTCVAGSCEPDTTYETDTAGCLDDRNGETCGAPTCTPSGVCGGFSSTCDNSGTQPWECRPSFCMGGACSGMGAATPEPSPRPCTRDTTGRPCGACGTCSLESCSDRPCDAGSGPTDVPCGDVYSCTEDYYSGTACQHVPHDEWCPSLVCQLVSCSPGDAGVGDGGVSSGCVYRPDPACSDSGMPPPIDAGSSFDAGEQCEPGACPCELPPAFGQIPCDTCQICMPLSPLRDYRGCIRMNPCFLDGM